MLKKNAYALITAQRLPLRLALALALAGVSLPASAELSLREELRVSGSIVRLGDVFLGAGEHADEPVAQAPEPGERAKLSLVTLEKMTRALGYSWARPHHLQQVTVVRDGVLLDRTMVDDLLREAASSEGYGQEYDLKLYGAFKNTYLPVDYDPADLRIDSIDVDDNSHRFVALLRLPDETGLERSVRLVGSMQEMREIPVLGAAVSPGEVITEDHIVWKSVQVQRLNSYTVQDMSDIVGKTVRRPLRTGDQLRRGDLQVPVVVEKGSYVVMYLESGPLTISATGRALENGGEGDIIRLMNVQSKQTVDARVMSSDKVKVIVPSAFLASN